MTPWTDNEMEKDWTMRPGLIPGVNVDRVDVGAGLQLAAQIGYDDPTAQIVAEYALMRHGRGEEEGARRSWLSEYPHDLTSWLRILAHARGSAESNAAAHGPWPDGTEVVFSDEAKSSMASDRTRSGLPTPAGSPDAVYTIDNTDDGLHDVILRENGERWGIAWPRCADSRMDDRRDALAAVIRAAAPDPLGRDVELAVADAIIAHLGSCAASGIDGKDRADLGDD